MKRASSLVLLGALHLSLAAQLTPGALERASIRDAICLQTAAYDSLVLIDKASYWYDDLEATGFAFRGDEVHIITVSIKPDPTLDSIAIGSITISDAIDKAKSTALRGIPYPALRYCSNDSLRLKSRSEVAWPLPSDQPEWAVLVTYPPTGESFLKRVYALDRLQYTWEQKLLLQVFNELDALLK